MVVARQRPATANGIVFMLLEDEWGTINLIIPPPVYDRHRMAVRTAPFVRVAGKLERRDANMNIVVDGSARLERPDLPLADVRPIEPPAERETGRDRRRGCRRDRRRSRLRRPRRGLPPPTASGGAGDEAPEPHCRAVFGRSPRPRARSLALT